LTIVGLEEGPDDGITSENLDNFFYPLQADKPALKVAGSTKDDGANYS